MKLSELINKLQDLQKQKGDIEVSNKAFENVYQPLYKKAKNSKYDDLELSREILQSFECGSDLFAYLINELEIKETKQIKQAFSKANGSHHSSGQVEVFWEFMDLLDLIGIEYKKDW